MVLVCQSVFPIPLRTVPYRFGIFQGKTFIGYLDTSFRNKYKNVITLDGKKNYSKAYSRKVGLAVLRVYELIEVTHRGNS